MTTTFLIAKQNKRADIPTNWNCLPVTIINLSPAKPVENYHFLTYLAPPTI